jgi:hypothetical protein
MIAYMAARTQAGVEFVGRGLDDTEIVARLAARALRRTYPGPKSPTPTFWSGNAYANDTVRRAVGEAVDTVLQKVGSHFHITPSVRGLARTFLHAERPAVGAYTIALLHHRRRSRGPHGPASVSRRSTRDSERRLRAEVARRAGSAVVFTVAFEAPRARDARSDCVVELRPLSAGPGPIDLELVVTKTAWSDGRVPVRVLFGACEFTDP